MNLSGWEDAVRKWDNVAMNAPQNVSPRRRLQELLAIPERQRTEAEWDEINELEISQAPGNRVDAGEPRPRSMPPAASPRPNEGGEGRKPFRKRHKKPPKAVTP
jgi:hypothetical protein